MMGNSAVLISVMGVFGQVALDAVGGLAHLVERLVDIAACGKFKLHAGKAFACLARHLVETFDGTEFAFHRVQKQSLGIDRADTVQPGRDKNQRQGHLGGRLLGDRDIGIGSGPEDQQQRHDDHAGPRESGVYQRGHSRTSGVADRVVAASVPVMVPVSVPVSVPMSLPGSLPVSLTVRTVSPSRTYP